MSQEYPTQELAPVSVEPERSWRRGLFSGRNLIIAAIALIAVAATGLAVLSAARSGPAVKNGAAPAQTGTGLSPNPLSTPSSPSVSRPAGTPGSTPTRPPAMAPKPAAEVPPGGAKVVFQVSLQHELVTELNRRRVQMGLKPLTYSPAMAEQSAGCAERNLIDNTLTHCGYECLAGVGKWASAAYVLNLWWHSPKHKTVLTAKNLRYAGGAMVYGNGHAIEALTVGK
jgi:uncharacterized protein YkwD